MSTHPALRAADLWRPADDQPARSRAARLRRNAVRHAWPELATELDALAHRYTSPTGELSIDQIAAQRTRDADAITTSGAIWLSCTAAGSAAGAYIVGTTGAYLVLGTLALWTGYLAADAWWRAR